MVSRATASTAPPRTKAPGPRGYPFLGHLPMMWQDLIGFFTKTAFCYGDIARFKVGPKQAFLISHPDYIRYIFQERDQNFSKTLFYDKMKPIFGEGLLTSNGEPWRRQRRIIQPIFYPERFSPQQSNERPRYVYFPFSGGPRTCIGKHFALMDMRLILAMALSAIPVCT